MVLEVVLEPHMAPMTGAAYVAAGAAAAGSIVLLGKLSMGRPSEEPAETDALVCKSGS